MELVSFNTQLISFIFHSSGEKSLKWSHLKVISKRKAVSLLTRARNESKLWISPSAKQRQSPWSGLPPVYQDLRIHRDWPVKKAIVDLPIRMKGNSKRTSGNSLSSSGGQNKDLGNVSQTLLTAVWLPLRRRLFPFSPYAAIAFQRSRVFHLSRTISTLFKRALFGPQIT